MASTRKRPRAAPTIDSKAEAVAVIPGDGADQLWLVARRTVDGSAKRYVEMLEAPLADDADQADAFYVDCGLSYDGAPVSTLSANTSSAPVIT